MVEAKYENGCLQVWGCIPHYRRPLPEIMLLRRTIFACLQDQGIPLPIKAKNIALIVHARKHEDGADLSNVVQAVCQALDGVTLSIKKDDIILQTDGQINSLSARWIDGRAKLPSPSKRSLATRAPPNPTNPHEQ